MKSSEKRTITAEDLKAGLSLYEIRRFLEPLGPASDNARVTARVGLGGQLKSITVETQVEDRQ